ncbi:hypothetical protein ACFQI9_33745 [Paraburkholderia dipogonis]|uniref:hypothetical protein n=1 Tax=Paraburkholderia dipogonis TaxID=1211383 RepID=UPI00361A2662
MKAGGAAPAERAREIRALLKHEITHFLDMTTTAWGGQYIFRKLRAAKSLNCSDEEGIATQRVFMLETTEVDVHKALLSTSNVAPTECLTMRHELLDDERFGMVLMINYYQGEKRCHSVPLSMLSLLEANATASEYLSRLADLEVNDDAVFRKIEGRMIEDRFIRLLNDPDRLEYSALLHLTRIHLSELPFRDLLAFVSALCRFALDATDLGMAAMANVIEASARNEDRGRALSMELRRASARPLLYFKTVLFVYGWMNEMDEPGRDAYLGLIQTDPHKAIQMLWVKRFGIDESALNLERSFMPASKIEWLKEIGILSDARIYEESFEANSGLLDHTPCGLLDFDQLKLLDVFLKDGTKITLPNRIDINVQDYFDENLQLFSDMQAMYRAQIPQRFYVGPNVIHINVG